MNWALEQRVVVDATARHVLLCLANYAGKDGDAAFPSTTTLSKDTGLSIRTVRYKLDHLEEIGVIRKGKQAIAAAYIDRHDRRPVVYDLVIERGAAAAARSERGANDDATGCSSQHNGVQMTTERGAAAAPNPSINHQVTITNPSLDANAPSRQKKWGSDQDHEAARWIFAKVRSLNPDHREPNWDCWANDVRLMREQDRRTHREICELFAWANSDDFWRVNILSPSKLRKQWDQLALKRNLPSNKKPGFIADTTKIRYDEELSHAATEW